MNGVIGLTGLLLDTTLDETQRQYAEGVQAAGDGLLGVINDILDYSKLEAGKVDIETIELDAGRVIDDVAGLVALPAMTRGLELIAYCHPDVPAGLRGDTGRIRQVLINLVSNAVKFTSNGEVVVSAQLLSQDADTAVVRFEVSDTGIGIAEKDRDRLFEPFAQADATTTRRYGGSGLGLAICVRLVEAMGGTMELVSALGQGSTFYFDLPLKKGPVTPGGAIDVSHSSLSGLRILVVDDNATNRWILSAQLEGWQMSVDLSEDGKSALRMMCEAADADRPYVMAVLDMHMPEMDGVELAQAISSNPVLAGTKLVLLTSGGAVDAETAAKVGLSARLTKPVRQSALQNQLLQLAAPAVTVPQQTRRRPVPVKATEASRGRLLIVEDNQLNQLVAQGMVSSLGYTFDTVDDGVKAVAALSADPTTYTAVLMDCHMPEMDGFEATIEIRRLEGTERHTPIIAMTASALAEDRDRCMAAGMDDFVTKPVDPQALAASLTRWADEPQRVSADRASATADLTAGQPPVSAQPVSAAPVSAQPVEPRAGVIDTKRLDALRRLGPQDGLGLLPVLVQVFLDDVPTRLASIEQAVSTSDAPALYQAAHQLKGAAANVGATAVAVLCAELEAIGRSGKSTAGAHHVSQLSADLDKAAGALNEIVSTAAVSNRG
jgi:two-component system sensor histidine kinase/response regulator